MTHQYLTSIHVLTPDLVEIHEEPEQYRMTRADVEEAITNVKATRSHYASNADYLKRLGFFEHILEMMDARVLISDAAAAKMHQIETGRQQ